MAEPGVDGYVPKRERRPCGDENFSTEDACQFLDETFLCGAVGALLEREQRDPIIEFLLDEKTKLHNSFCPDLLFYWNQTHTLLGLMCSHPLHPFPQCFRWLVLVANLAFSFTASTVAGYLEHVNSPWSDPTNWIIGPIICNLLTEMLVLFVKCECVQRQGTRRIYRWGGTFIGRLIFLACWLVLVPVFVIAGLSFDSFKSQDDIDAGVLGEGVLDINQIRDDFHPSWHLALDWFYQTLIEWASEFLLLLAFFCYTRYYGSEAEVETGLMERRQEWLEDDLAQRDPLIRKPTAGPTQKFDDKETSKDVEQGDKFLLKDDARPDARTAASEGLVDPATQ